MVDQSLPAKTDIRICFERLKRTARYRLVTPLQRSRHPPGYVARGVSAGLFWAMTPTVGIQMILVVITAFLTKPFLHFNRVWPAKLNPAWIQLVLKTDYT